MIKSTLLATLVAVSVSAPVVADLYDVDAAHTTLGFGVRHMVVSTVRGSFGEFKGELDFDAAKPGNTKASATIQVKSISTDNQKRDDHLRSADFFDAEKFPTITFESTGVEKSGEGYILRGKFTMKETTKDVAIPVTFSGPVEDPWGNTRVGFEGSFKVNRKDFGVNFDGKLKSGDAVVGDEVKITLDVEAIKRK